MASNPYEALLGEVLGRKVARTARGIPTKVTTNRKVTPAGRPAAKKAVKSKAQSEGKSPAGPRVGPTPQRAIAEGTARRAYLNSPKGRKAQVRARQASELDAIIARHTGSVTTNVDPEFAELKADVARYEASKRAGNVFGIADSRTSPEATNPLTRTKLAGFDPSRLQGAPGASFVGGFLQNLGRGAIRTITDAPLAAQLGAEAILGAAATGVNLATGNRSPAGTGRGPVNSAQGMSRALEKRSKEDLGRAATGIKQDYVRRWGPLNPVGGEGVKIFGQRFYEDPLPTLLDAAGAYSVVGRAPGAAARAGAALTRGRISERLAEAGSRSRIAPGEVNPVTGKVSEMGGKLYRAPRRIVSQASRETKKGDIRTATNTIEVPRRPYSPNIITRVAQRTADNLRAQIVPRIEAAAERRQPAPGQPGSPSSHALKLLTAQARFDRAQRRGVRDIVFEREQLASGTFNREVAPFARAVRSLKPDKNAAGVRQKGLGSEHYAATLHLLDVLAPRAGMTARQLRDAVVTKMEETIAKAEARAARTGQAPPRVEMTARNIAQIEAIPDELLELKDMTNPAVKRVVAAVQAGRELDTLSQAKAVRAGIVSSKTAADIKGRAAGLLLGGQEWSPALIRELRASGASKSEIAAVRESAITKTPSLIAKREKLAGAEAALSQAGEGASAPALRAATRKRDKYLKAVRAEENRRLGFTPPIRPEMVTGKGVYFPKKPADVMGGGGKFPRRKGLAGPPKAKAETGYLTQSGNFDMNPNLLASALKRSTEAEVGPISDAALQEFISLGAYTDKSGALVSGTKAAQLARTDPERVILIHKGKLRQAMARLDEVEDGKTLESGEVRFFFGTGKESWLQELPKGKVSNQYVAVSKAAADVWREAATTNPFLRAADTLMDYFKGGILALSPRWFLNSSVGVASQYGLLAGLDIKSIRQANKLGAVRDAIPDAVVLNNLAHEMGMQAGINPNRLRKVFHAGFRLNDRMESIWRRGAYVNRAKKALRDEGVSTRKMTNAEIAHAIENMPPSLARNIVRDLDLFMGEFRKFSKVERDVIKRVVPWYSWLRVIARLTFTLPFHSPIRAAAISALGRAGEAGLAPDDFMRPVYQRGDLVLGDSIRIPTGGINSAATLLGPLEAGVKVADNPGGALGIVGEEAGSWVRPEIQTVLASTYGTNPFGGPLIAPGGYAGTVSGYGGSKQLNPASGLPDNARVRVPADEALLQAFGGAPVQAIRKYAAGGNRPFDTQRTIPMLAAKLSGGSQEGMFLDPAKRPVRTQFWNGLGSTVGVNPVRESSAQLIRRYREAMRDIERQMRKQAAKDRRHTR